MVISVFLMTGDVSYRSTHHRRPVCVWDGYRICLAPHCPVVLHVPAAHSPLYVFPQTGVVCTVQPGIFLKYPFLLVV